MRGRRSLGATFRNSRLHAISLGYMADTLASCLLPYYRRFFVGPFSGKSDPRRSAPHVVLTASHIIRSNSKRVNPAARPILDIQLLIVLRIAPAVVRSVSLLLFCIHGLHLHRLVCNTAVPLTSRMKSDAHWCQGRYSDMDIPEGISTNARFRGWVPSEIGPGRKQTWIGS